MMTDEFVFNDTLNDISLLNRIDIQITRTTKKDEQNNARKEGTPDISTKTTYSSTPTSTISNNDALFDDSMFLSESFNNLLAEKCSAELNNSQKRTLLSQAIFDSPNTSHCSFTALSDSYGEQNISFNYNMSQNTNSFNRNVSQTSINDTNNSQTVAKETLVHLEQLSSWGLPRTILQKYEEKNIRTMFPWQVECLNLKNVIENNANLVYSAPTSAGKTLVAEILAIKTILERKQKVLFILPFVSVVREKMFYFQDILSSSGVRVEGFMGSYNPPGGFRGVQLAVCTIEKANSLINRLLEEDKLSNIGTVIIDELHLIGDSHRGYLLELMLTKLLYMSASAKIQIVGMSATLPNLKILAKWLDAELYTTSFRPIPLYEQAHVDYEIYDNTLKVVRQLPKLTELGVDTDNILQLCLETIQENCSVLIFCPTKNWCENLAEQIAAAFYKLGHTQTEIGTNLRTQLNSDAIIELLEQLKRCPSGLDKILHRTVSFGVAFHHAGLTMDERDIIEGAFRSNVVRVLVATSTLSSGVNLPARRVIIRTPIFHGKPLDVLAYRQMIGRAGRMGRDTAGDSILVCQKGDFHVAKTLMSGELSAIESCLYGSGRLKRALLEVIASGIVSTPEDVSRFTQCTLLAVDTQDELQDPISESVEFLERNEFVRLQTLDDGGTKYVATSLAKACLSSSMPPEEGLALFTELEKARQCFVLETELHLVYLVTPYSASNQLGNLDWMLFLDLWEKLPASMKRVGELVGVKEGYIVNASRGKIQTNTSKLLHKLMIHKRFYTSLILQDLVNELPLNTVSVKYNCSRGVLQSLQQSAASFAGMVTTFSHQLGWNNVEILISQFQDRMQFGVNRELLDLMRLPILNGARARALYNAGIETLVDLASTEVCTLENVLHKIGPFESEKGREGETEYELQRRTKMRNVWIMGRQGLSEKEAAVMFIQEAQKYLQLEMGLSKAVWKVANDTVGEKQPEGGESSEEEQQKVIVEPRCDTLSPTSEAFSNSSFELHLSPSKDNSSDHSFSDVSLFEDSLECNKDTRVDALNETFENITSFQEAIKNSENDPFIVPKPNCSETNKRNHQTDVDKCETSFEDNEMCLKKPKLLDEQIQTKQNHEFTTIEIVNVCDDKRLFECFCKEQKHYNEMTFSVACSKTTKKECRIGAASNNSENDSENVFSDAFLHKNVHVEGFAVNWGGNTTYYISLNNDIIPKRTKIALLKEILSTSKTLRIFDCKEQLKLLQQSCETTFNCTLHDPKVIDWILDPEGKEKHLQAMAVKYHSDIVQLTQLVGHCKGVGSVGMDLNSSVRPRVRACIESMAVWYLVESAEASLRQQDSRLVDVYKIEMKTMACLTKMELDGVGVSTDSLQKLANDLKALQLQLEKDAFSLAGRRFSFTSSSDVAKVIGIYKGRKVSTSKQVLEKNETPLSNIVLQWRKLNSTLTKMVFPLLRCVRNERIHGCSITHTATGRITMQEPNLQSVPREFQISSCLMTNPATVSCRSVFVPCSNCIFLSADYCQLELRLLAHLSEDELLRSVMKTDEDVFKLVAAKWYGIKEEEVTDNVRQRAKQMCYGIIYGMGAKTLSEQMSVSEEDATDLMDAFHQKYPGIKKYIERIVATCKENQFVETITGRRRYFPNINHQTLTTQNQAIRQAVNTTIQGSAADLAKNAMVTIDNDFNNRFGNLNERPKLVLHLHDELLYEVPTKYLISVARIVKKCMEGSTNLSVPFPVKLKSGTSWGSMKELML